MTKNDAINLLTACPVGGPDGECSLGEAVNRLAGRLGVPLGLSVVTHLIDRGYLDHGRSERGARVAADFHWHGLAARLLADQPELLAELGVRS